MQSKKEKNNSLIIIGCFLILLGVTCLISKVLYNHLLDKEEDEKIEDFYKEQEVIKINNDIEPVYEGVEELTDSSSKQYKIDYVAVLKIPKINLEKGLCYKGTYCNNVSRNIEILDSSNYPDVSKGNFILVGHSGSGRLAYFNNLMRLENGDDIIVFFNGHEYRYEVSNKYEIEKNGHAEIRRNEDNTTITLITCKVHENKQIVIIADLKQID